MRSIVLLSGGLDSTVSFKKALDETKIQLVLTFDYGQRSAPKEILAATKICYLFKIKHKIIRLDWLKEITKTSLVNLKEDIPEVDRIFLDNFSKTSATAKKVWVPNRNGIFINIAAAFAETLKANLIVTGFNAEEAVTFSDNSFQFIEAINKSLEFSTLNHPKIISYTLNLNKEEVVKLAKKIGAPLNLIWSCYHGNKTMCGKCESCQRLYRALELTNNTNLIEGRMDNVT